MSLERIRLKSLRDKIVSAEEACQLINNGDVVGMSGFTRAGDAKALPAAMATRAKSEDFKISLMTGASLAEADRLLAEAGAISRRCPFQADATLRKAINRGEVMYIDQHLSKTGEYIRSGQIPGIDVAVLEAVAITEEGFIVPSTSVGNSGLWGVSAEKIIVEVNEAQPIELEGIHDVFVPDPRGHRRPFNITDVRDRLGTPYIQVDPSRIAAIVMTNQLDNPAAVSPLDDETATMAGHLIDFLINEVKQGRLTNSLLPLQAGIGIIANAVLNGFAKAPFENMVMWSEVLQDSTFDLFDSGKLLFASGASVMLSAGRTKDWFNDINAYKGKMVLRPQEISNHPECVRRFGTIGVNTALEVDFYGNVNSTHVTGTHMMNGIGGSGDFARQGHMGIFVTKSLAKDGKISSLVPMVAHHDHTEHDVDVIVTERGLADLRGLAPRERSKVIIDNCVHPIYQDLARDYINEATKRGGHTPHVLEKAFSWHTNYNEFGTMLPK
jgi:succinyl-CoA:acetate CoA-transferase